MCLIKNSAINHTATFCIFPIPCGEGGSRVIVKLIHPPLPPSKEGGVVDKSFTSCVYNFCSGRIYATIEKS